MPDRTIVRCVDRNYWDIYIPLNSYLLQVAVLFLVANPAIRYIFRAELRHKRMPLLSGLGNETLGLKDCKILRWYSPVL